MAILLHGITIHALALKQHARTHGITLIQPLELIQSNLNPEIQPFKILLYLPEQFPSLLHAQTNAVHLELSNVLEADIRLVTIMMLIAV